MSAFMILQFTEFYDLTSNISQFCDEKEVILQLLDRKAHIILIFFEIKNVCKYKSAEGYIYIML